MIRRGLHLSERLVRRSSARAQLFASGVLFGLLAVLARICAKGGFTPGQVSLIRFATGAALSLGLFAARPGTYAPVRRGLLFTRGALGGLAAFLYFAALARIPAGEATLINNTFPILATVLSFITLGERPTAHLGAGLILASFGVFLALGGGSTSFHLGWGEVAAVASAVLGAGAVTSIRALRATDNAPTIFFSFCLGGLAVSCPFALGSWPIDRVLWAIALLGVGLSSFAAQLFMTHAYGKVTVSEAAVWQQLTPVASYLWALGLLDERLSATGSLGVGLGIAGVVYGTVLGHRPAGRGRPVPAATEPPVDG